MRFAFISIISLLYPQALLSLQAQVNKSGVPMLTNYSYHETGGAKQNWCITHDHRGVLYVGNNEKGILEYDGVQWRNIATPGSMPVFSLVTGDDGVVYVGAEDDFGLLEPDQRGELRYRSLCDSSLRQPDSSFIVWKSYAHDNRIWFCSHEGIYVFDPATENVDFISTPAKAYHSYMVDGRLYNSNRSEGLMVLGDGRFEGIPGGESFRDMDITGMEDFDAGNLLVSTLEHGIYILDSETGELNDNFLGRKLKEEFRQIQITCIKLLIDDLLVCTHSNGLYVLDRQGMLKEVISEKEGLINNTILHICTDDRLNDSGPLWLAHRKGVSKIERNNPFRVFTESSGFENLITGIRHFNGKLFVATMDGLYYQSSSESGTSFLKLAGISGEVNDLHLFQPSRGRTMLLASSFTDFFIIDRYMRVSSLRHNLNDFKGDEEDLRQIAGRCILNDPERSNVVYTGLRHAVGLQYSRGRWREIFRSDKLEGDIQHLVSDRYGYLWVSTPGNLVRIDMELSPAFTMKAFSHKDGLPFNEDNRVFLNPVNGNVMTGTRDGFYSFNYFQDRFVPDSLFNTLLPRGPNMIRSFFEDREGDFWTSFENETLGWKEMVLSKQEDHLKVLIEKPFHRLPSSAPASVFFSDPDSGVWFSKSDELYHFNKRFSRNDSLPFQTLIRKVIINGDSILFMGTHFKEKGPGRYTIRASQDYDSRPRLAYRFNSIRFQWAAPCFELEDRLQYRYFLEGSGKSWAEWQELPFKEFARLKYGRYTLRLKARNVYGFESAETSYAFVIKRPWYASFLAFTGYILFAGLLIYRFVRPHTRRLQRKVMFW